MEEKYAEERTKIKELRGAVTDQNQRMKAIHNGERGIILNSVPEMKSDFEKLIQELRTFLNQVFDLEVKFLECCSVSVELRGIEMVRGEIKRLEELVPIYNSRILQMEREIILRQLQDGFGEGKKSYFIDEQGNRWMLKD